MPILTSGRNGRPLAAPITQNGRRWYYRRTSPRFCPQLRRRGSLRFQLPEMHEKALVRPRSSGACSRGAEMAERNPATLDPVWREVSGGIYRLDKNLLIVLDVARVLDFSARAEAA